MQKVNVITIYNFNVPYTYLCNKSLNLKVGDLVIVEVRNKKTYGLIVNYSSNGYDKELKEVINKIEHIKLSLDFTKFIQWCANYNMISLGSILKMSFPMPELILNWCGKREIDNNLYNKTTNSSIIEHPLNNQEKKALELFKKHEQLNNMVIKKLKINNTHLDTLIKLGLVISIKENIGYTGTSKQEYIKLNLKSILNSKQQQVCNKLLNVIRQNKFSVSLLDGVPGAGKTEVYFELIAEVVKKNKAVLVLLPEIALSTQWLNRFKNYFEVLPYVWHSGLTKKEKKTVFLDIINEKVKVIVGTRSALFLPINNLGLIIVDEEHDSSFKQEDKVVYSARDMSIVRASFEKIPVLLTTATPSIETWYNCKIGKYNYFQLTKRFNKSLMPIIKLVDMNISNIVKGEVLSDILVDKLIKNFHNKRQSLLFLNKRGYSNFNICIHCKTKIICPRCSYGEENIVYLIAHKSKKKFICHRCNFWQFLSTDCNVCNKKECIINYGTGIEKVEEELRTKIPQARITLASSDIINSANKAELLIQDIIENKVDIIIGTQILAKGYHFPNLTLVGIVDADLVSNSMDLKSNERIWQVLYQVAGRAGRENIQGEVILQCYHNNYLIQTLINFQRDKFLDKELNDRLENNLPPYTRLGSLILSAKNEQKLLETVNQLKRSIIKLPKAYHTTIKGPAPALFYKINQRYRYRFLIVNDKKFNLQKLIYSWINLNKIPSSVNLKIDIDPISFY